MFAVVILGIGLIMTASLFPIGIRQAKEASEATAGGIAARAAKDVAANLAGDRPPVVNFGGTLDVVAPYNLPPTDFINVTPSGGVLGPRTHIGTEGFGYGEDIGDTDDASYLGGAGGAFNLPASGNSVAFSRHFPGTFVYFGDERFNDLTDSGAYAFGWESILRNKVRGQSVISGDPRFGVVPLYARGRTIVNNAFDTAGNNAGASSTDPTTGVFADDTAQFVVVVQQSRNTEFYTQFDTDGLTFVPIGVFVQLDEGDDTIGGTDGIDRLRFTDGGGDVLTHGDVPAAVEGAFVVIADDRLDLDDPTTATSEARGSANGRVYRLGRRIGSDAGDDALYELAPGFDMAYSENGGSPMTEVTGTPYAYLVGGKQPVYDAAGVFQGYEGSAQAVAVYTSVVPVN
jgi:type II secretory pathway pseudopilin PulG